VPDAVRVLVSLAGKEQQLDASRPYSFVCVRIRCIGETAISYAAGVCMQRSYLPVPHSWRDVSERREKGETQRERVCVCV